MNDHCGCAYDKPLPDTPERILTDRVRCYPSSRSRGIRREAGNPQWLRELDAEMLNSGCEVGAVWAKVAGKASAGDGVILMSPKTLVLLLKQAGY